MFKRDATIRLENYGNGGGSFVVSDRETTLTLEISKSDLMDLLAGRNVILYGHHIEVSASAEPRTIAEINRDKMLATELTEDIFIAVRSQAYSMPGGDWDTRSKRFFNHLEKLGLITRLQGTAPVGDNKVYTSYRINEDVE